MKVIGLIGPKGSGKDASYEILKKKGKAAGKIAFAGPLKSICSEVFNIPFIILNDPDFKERPFEEMEKYDNVVLTSRALKAIKLACCRKLPEFDPKTNTWLYNVDKVAITGVENRIMKTPRELLQVVGTDFIRNRVYSDWHLRAAFHDNVLMGLKSNGTYCVTDIRFPNELKFLQEKFGDSFSAYYVERPEAEDRLAEATHPSELGVLELRDLIPDTNIIKNNKTLAELEKRVLKLAPAKRGRKAKSETVVSTDKESLRRGRWVSKAAKEKGIS